MNQLQYQRVGIIYGVAGSSAIHWQTWLARKCRTAGAETIYPKLPDAHQPKLAAWLEALERTMPTIDGTTALVGHSMGCVTILQLLQREHISEVGLVVLVSPSSRSRVEKSDLSFLLPFWDGLDLSIAAGKTRRIEVFASDNDRWVDPVDAKRISTQFQIPKPDFL